MDKIAATPDPPYFAVIFTSLLRADDPEYGQMADRMIALASEQPGFLGVESARGSDGLGITVSYWESLDSITNWRAHSEHRIAQERGIADWYARYELRISKVERAYGFAA